MKIFRSRVGQVIWISAGVSVALMGGLTSSGCAGTRARDADASFLSTNDQAPLPDWAVPSPELQERVQFWVKIYSEYSTHHAVIHDAKNLNIVYEVVDLRGLEKAKKRVLKDTREKWKRALLAVHRDPEPRKDRSPEEKKVIELYSKTNEPDKYLSATHRKRLRMQLGQKNRFLEGMYESGRLLPLMEEVFRKEGLPPILTRLPFVESSFNTKARSKVGASGIWQFMRSTGKLFLKINDSVDERNDPLRATEAAAKLLKVNFETLGKWPLAVTAYNHGRQGMVRAVSQVGSDRLEDVIDGYSGRAFGFASSNFFACLLAAIEVERNSEKYFGTVLRAPLDEFYEARLPEAFEFQDLVRSLGLERSTLLQFNPGLSDLTLRGKRLVPKGYRLRLPRNIAQNETALGERLASNLQGALRARKVNLKLSASDFYATDPEARQNLGGSQ